MAPEVAGRRGVGRDLEAGADFVGAGVDDAVFHQSGRLINGSINDEMTK
jgi:hypothetical protein